MAGLRALSSRLSRFRDTLPVIDDIRFRAVIAVFPVCPVIGAELEAVRAREATRIGVGLTFGCWGGFGVRRVRTFLFLLVGGDLVAEIW